MICLAAGGEITERRKAMETDSRRAWLFLWLGGGEITESRKAMETNRIHHLPLPITQLAGKSLNAERQWRLIAAEVGFLFGSAAGKSLNAERQWRRIQFIPCPCPSLSSRGNH